MYRHWTEVTQSLVAVLFIASGLILGSNEQWAGGVLLGFAAGALSRTVVMRMSWLPVRRDRRDDD